MTQSRDDVLIVGSGPSGLMAALLLQHCGVKVRIFDKSEQQAHESRALALQARSLELLMNIGIVDAFIERGVIAPGVKIYVDGHQAAEMNLTDIGGDNSPYPFVLMLSQAEIEKLLVAELEKRGIQVEHNTEVTGFTQNDNGVVVTATSQGQTKEFHASYVLGADGSHSVIREVMGLKFEGAAYPQNFMLADCKLDWELDYNFVKVFLRDTYLGIFFAIKGTSMCRIVAITPHTDKDENTDNSDAKTATTALPLTLTEIERAFQDAVGLPLKCSDPVWVSRYRIHHRAVNKYVEKRAIVAGDAAHVHSPVGGQGMNTGLQDVANLAWKLALTIKGKGSQQLVESYNAERWPVGQKLLHFTDALFEKVSSQSAGRAALRNFLMPLVAKVVSHIRFCRFKLFRFISELGIRYHDNDFLLDEAANRFPRESSPGYRAPNGIYQRNHDIFGLIKGYQFNLLVLSKKALSEAEIDKIAEQLDQVPKDIGLPLTTHFISNSMTGENKKILQAECCQAFERYGVSDKNPFAVFLIRPDGHIAYRSDELKAEKIKKFIDRFLGKK